MSPSSLELTYPTTKTFLLWLTPKHKIKFFGTCELHQLEEYLPAITYGRTLPLVFTQHEYLNKYKLLILISSDEELFLTILTKGMRLIEWQGIYVIVRNKRCWILK